MSVAKHLRIIDPAPSDDFVTKREAAVKALRGRFLKVKTVSELMQLGGSLALGCFGQSAVLDATKQQIVDALTKESPAFIEDERALEVKLCGLLAIIEAIEHGGVTPDRWAVADVYAVAVWASLSFIPVQSEGKLEQLRSEAIETSRNRVLKTAVSSRQRMRVSDIDSLAIDPGATTLPAILGDAIAALRSNAALDREEIDLLWWVIADGSDILNKPLQQVAAPIRAIVSGYEVGAMLRRLPSQAHNHLVQRNVTASEPMSLMEIVQALGGDREKIAAAYASQSLVDLAPQMFPVLNAIRTGNATGPSAELKRPLGEWAVRVLLESSALRIQYSESGKL